MNINYYLNIIADFKVLQLIAFIFINMIWDENTKDLDSKTYSIIIVIFLTAELLIRKVYAHELCRESEICVKTSFQPNNHHGMRRET